MRRVVASVTLVLAAATSTGRAAQDRQDARQTFRAEVELITIDVIAVDGQGRPVEDLRAADFAVEVDGRTRPVVSADLVRAGQRPDVVPAAPAATLVSTNAVVPGARRIAIAVDQSRILPAGVTPILRTASRFLEGLTPADHVAFLVFPEPGPRVDFTTDKDRIRRAMEEGIVGQPSRVVTRMFGISLTEAIALNDKENTQAASVGFGTPNYQETVLARAPALRRVLERSLCEGLTLEELMLPENVGPFRFCMGQVRNESSLIALETRAEANVSLRRLESFLAELALLDGPKSLVLISAGLFNDDLTILDELARLAAAARTTIHVIAVDPANENVEILGVPNGQSPTTLQDRQFALNGLEIIADRTGGGLYRAVGNAQGIFDRLGTELSAWYVLGVERQPGDPERQQVEVDVRRRGVTVRSNRTVVAEAALRAGRSPDDLLSDALSSPVAIAGVPLRMSTFVRQDEAGKHRVHVAAEIGEPGAPGGEFAIVYVVMDDGNRVVTSLGRRQTLSPAAGANEPLHFDTAILLEPGNYFIRLGVVDPGGRRGTVVRRVDVVPPGDGVSASDLIVGDLPASGAVMHPAVEPHVGGRVAGYLEVYLPAGAEDVAVTLEIAEGDASPALAAQTLAMREGPQPSWRVAMGVVDAPLAPGRYLARARIHRGDETIRVITRPFVLEPGEARPTVPPERERPAPVSLELRQRTGAYIGAVFGALSNIVGREELVLVDPDRRVTSEILLVRYPGSERDLLVYRDVSHVDGKLLAGRQARLAELFLKPVSGLRERARRIALDAEEHVPSALNPLFALAFLQADFQARLELTTGDAGPEWPREVTAIAFVETARPTLLRAGPLGNLDVPARGTAWVEEATGRVVQTELRLGSGRSATTVVTRFALDERLQVVVPRVMHTRNPDGVATYTDFRRFNVQTETTVPSDGR